MRGRATAESPAPRERPLARSSIAQQGGGDAGTGQRLSRHHGDHAALAQRLRRGVVEEIVVLGFPPRMRDHPLRAVVVSAPKIGALGAAPPRAPE